MSEITKNTKEEKVFVFPELVFKELLAIIVALIVLTIWSLAVDAPLKGIADPNWTENPAKAPWYFVGLQDLLVYFDPWIAGVSIPLIIILGLASIPYLDPNPKGVGEFNVRDRKLVVSFFLFGYILWFVLIIVGQFLRGPNWQFYWPWEDWSVEKSAEEALFNLPNSIGLLLLVGYFSIGLVAPALLAKDLFKKIVMVKNIINHHLLLFH